MKKYFLLKSVMLFAVLITVLSFGTSAVIAADKVYRMKIQSAWPRADISMQTLETFAASAAKRSNGQIKIQVFAALLLSLTLVAGIVGTTIGFVRSNLEARRPRRNWTVPAPWPFSLKDGCCSNVRNTLRH